MGTVFSFQHVDLNLALRRRRDPWISVEEVLLGILLVEEVPLVGAEQRVWVLLERVLPCLEAAAAYVHNQLLVLDGFLRWAWEWDYRRTRLRPLK